MTLLKTKRRHWVNGHQIRGGYFHTLTLSCYFYAVMFSWGDLPSYSQNYLKISLYKLI